MDVEQKPTHRISRPMDFEIPAVVIHGLPLPIVADLPEGGFMQITPGPNPMAPPVPSVSMAPGCMVAIICADVAAQLRPHLKKMEADRLKGNPLVNQGAILHPQKPQGID